MHENWLEYDENGSFGPKTGNGQKPEVVHNFFFEDTIFNNPYDHKIRKKQVSRKAQEGCT